MNKKCWESAVGRKGFIKTVAAMSVALLLGAALCACGGGGGGSSGGGDNTGTGTGTGTGSSGSSGSTTSTGSSNPNDRSAETAAWVTPSCALPEAINTSGMAHVVVGNGSAASCTSTALSDAVAQARAGAQAGRITFNCGSSPMVIAVNAEISIGNSNNISKTTVIDGGDLITLDGQGTHRIFNVGQAQTLSLRNIALQNAYSKPPHDTDSPTPYSGGAIVAGYQARLELIHTTFSHNQSSSGGALHIGSDGTLTVVDSTFDNNSSWYGGAIKGLLSGLTVVNSTFTNNSAPKNSNGDYGWGGGIATDGANLNSYLHGGVGKGGTLAVCGSRFQGNSSGSGGGGVWLWAYAPDAIVVKNSSFQGNSTDGLGGAGRISTGYTDNTYQNGAITAPGLLAVIGSSFVSNTSKGNAGALYMDCYGQCDVINSSFYGNDAGGVGSAVQHVGWNAQYGYQAQAVAFTNTTFVDNTRGLSTLFGSRFVLNNTALVSHTTRTLCSDSSNTGSRVLQYSSQGATGNCLASGTPITADPLLSNPAANGGPTPTMLPASNSPLRRAGANCPTIDQRGVSRSAAQCDVGAVELGP